MKVRELECAMQFKFTGRRRIEITFLTYFNAAPARDDDDDDDLDWGIETNEQDSITQQVLSMPASSMDSNETQSPTANKASTLNDPARQPDVATTQKVVDVITSTASTASSSGKRKEDDSAKAAPANFQLTTQVTTKPAQPDSIEHLEGQTLQERAVIHEPEIVPEPTSQEARQSEHVANKAGGWSTGWNFSALKGSLTAIAAGKHCISSFNTPTF